MRCAADSAFCSAASAADAMSRSSLRRRSETSHRLSWRRSLGAGRESMPRVQASTAEALRLPASVAAFPEQQLNDVALFVAGGVCRPRAALRQPMPIRFGPTSARLQAAQIMTRATLAACPGLRQLHQALQMRIRQLRVTTALAALRGSGREPPSSTSWEGRRQRTRWQPRLRRPCVARLQSLSAFTAPRGYKAV